MSSDNEDQLSPRSLVGTSTPESDPKMPRIRYTRDFLLSLSELDVCKNFPRGFDKSILSDLGEAANTTFERQRSVGSLFLQGSRRGDYGPQSLNRPEISNSFTRGSPGRWDSRSSGSSDREGDLQCDHESFSQDSGRRFGSQNRRNWQNLEQDGLLGSGAFARPSGYSGVSAQKSRGNSHYQLNRTSEPYQPPKPYKAAPYPRKDYSDSCNEKTFGSTECASEDRAEEERKRRESFELMRKEQHKTLQGKQGKDILKGKLDVDIMALLENSDTDKSAQNRGMPEESASSSLCESDSLKSSSHIHVPAARPLVPPGFASALAEKKHEINKLKNTSLQSVDGKENPSALPSVEADVGFGKASFVGSDLQEVNEVWEENTPNDFFDKKDAGPRRIDVVTQDYSTSILGKLFGSATTETSDSLANDIQNHVDEAGEARAHVASSASKFAHLFHEESEEKNPVEDTSSRDLLSLIISNDKLGSQLNDEATKQSQSTSTCENNVAAVLLNSPTATTFGGLPSESYQRDEQSLSHAVLTCEDLEQSILADVKDNSSGMQYLLESWPAMDDKSEHKDVVDDHASQHLLSLLQRGTNSKDSLSSPKQDVIGSHEMLAASDVESTLCLQFAQNAATISEIDHRSEKHLTLEALFGVAFMNELHSIDAPISSQRASVGKVQVSGASQSDELPFYLDADSLTYTSIDQNSKKALLEGEMPQLKNATEHKRAHHNAGSWAGYRGSHLHALKPSDVAFEEVPGDIQLPEEDSLISLNDSLDPVALHCQKENRNESHVTIGDFNDALVHAILRDGGSREPALDCPPLMHSSHEMVDTDSFYHHLLGRSASQFPHQVNHARPLFTAHLDHSTFINPQMNFVSPDAMHRDPHHHFAPNIYPHHSYNRINGTHFDPASHHPMPLPMQVPGNFPPHSSMQGLPRQPLPHPINHMPGSLHEMSNPHAFPLNHHRQPNNGGLGLGMPGIVGTAAGRPPPEVLERLVELEMRANQKQFHPAMAGYVSGMYGTEVDMNLRYK